MEIKMEELEKAALKRIDDMKDEIIKFHQQIIQIPSENPPICRRIEKTRSIVKH